MLTYLDRAFCNCRDCATQCHRRFYGTQHEANAKRVGLPVSLHPLTGGDMCNGYAVKRESNTANDALRGRAAAGCEGPLEGTVMRKE